jgi:hypothetical protein
VITVTVALAKDTKTFEMTNRRLIQNVWREIGKYQNRQKLLVKFIGFVGSMMDILKYPCRLLIAKESIIVK